ncbi:hypothetical protein C7Q91_07490 [Staphylococcus aureus]|nr:hypothetical protein C7Q91_07490 [Staphylococcus aureus]
MKLIPYKAPEEMIIFWRFCMFRNIFFYNRMEANTFSFWKAILIFIGNGITFNIVIDIENK